MPDEVSGFRSPMTDILSRPRAARAAKDARSGCQSKSGKSDCAAFHGTQAADSLTWDN